MRPNKDIGKDVGKDVGKDCHQVGAFGAIYTTNHTKTNIIICFCTLK